MRRAYAAIKATVGHFGQATIAGALGVDDSDLHRAVERKKQRGLWLEYAIAIGTVARPDVQAELAAALVEPLGYAITPLRPLTPEEKNAKYELALISRFGEAGKQLVDEINR